MSSFKEIIGKKLTRIFTEPFEVGKKFENNLFNGDLPVENLYVVLVTDNNETYVISAQGSTALGTDYLGILRNELIEQKTYIGNLAFNDFIDVPVLNAELFYNIEGWLE